MKRFLFSFVFLSQFLISKAQVYDKALAMQLVTKNSTAIGLSNDDLNNVLVSSTYYNKFAGTQMVYLQQSLMGLPVYNVMQVLAFKNEKLVSIAGERIKSILKVLGNVNQIPTVTPDRAVLTAITEKKLNSKAIIGSPLALQNSSKLDFGKAFVRNLCRLISNFTFFIGYIIAGFTEKKQALHDIIAGTLVIKKDQSAQV